MSRNHVSEVWTVLALGLAVGTASVRAQADHDDFYHLGEINKASLVMLTEVGLVPETVFLNAHNTSRVVGPPERHPPTRDRQQGAEDVCALRRSDRRGR